MKEFQEQVDNWISKYKLGYFKPHENLARLIEEVGEVAREINHKFGPKKKKLEEKNVNLGDELADVIYTVVCIANSLNIDLDKHLKRILKKYDTRDKDRWERK